MDTKALRQKILDLAIRGKLVPQDPNDEPASVLLERIRAEKQQMVKDGKLKAKDIKNDTVIFKGDDNLHYEQFADGTVKCIEDEIPFELPDGWAWARLGNIGEIITGGTPSKSHHEYYGNAFPFFKPADLDQGRKTIISSEYLSEKGKSCCRIIPKFSTAVCCIGSIGKCGYLNVEGTTNQQINSVIPNIDSLYAYYYCSSDYFLEQLISLASATTIAIVNKSKMESVLIPVPPMAEQQRIANTLDTELGLIATLEVEKSDIIVAINNVKSKILDLAIRGKLVPQDPNDEPASVLLERIRAEKEELIKQGKIKRDKKESVIFKGDDNSYYEKIGDEITCIDDFLSFDIPDTWTWTRLKNIGDVIGGGTPKTNNHNYWDGEIPWVTPADLSGYKNMYIAHGSRFITELGLKESSAQLLPKDSVLFSSRAPIGYIAIAENAIATNQGFKSVSPYISGISEYLYFCLKRCTDDIIQRASGTTFKEISGSEMSETLVPIPSLNEQKKIVNRISDLFAVINNVEASLN